MRIFKSGIIKIITVKMILYEQCWDYDFRIALLFRRCGCSVIT